MLQVNSNLGEERDMGGKGMLFFTIIWFIKLKIKKKHFDFNLNFCSFLRLKIKSLIIFIPEIF